MKNKFSNFAPELRELCASLVDASVNLKNV